MWRERVVVVWLIGLSVASCHQSSVLRVVHELPRRYAELPSRFDGLTLDLKGLRDQNLAYANPLYVALRDRVTVLEQERGYDAMALLRRDLEEAAWLWEQVQRRPLRTRGGSP